MSPNTEENNREDLGSIQHLVSLERKIMHLEVAVERLNEKFDRMLVETEGREGVVPNTALFSRNFLARAFTVWGHFIVANLLIVAPIYVFIFFLALLLD